MQLSRVCGRSLHDLGLNLRGSDQKSVQVPATETYTAKPHATEPPLSRGFLGLNLRGSDRETEMLRAPPQNGPRAA